MPRRQSKSRRRERPLPRLWLFTDERVADDTLLASARALPQGSGIVFRHYRTSRTARRALYDRLRAVAKRRRLVLLLAGRAQDAAAWQADGIHAGSTAHRLRGVRRGLRSTAAHDAKQLRAAERAGADLVFLSPVFPTRSHPGARALGPLRFGLIAKHARIPVVALGGMTAARFAHINALGAHGWAAIDGLTANGAHPCSSTHQRKAM